MGTILIRFAAVLIAVAVLTFLIVKIILIKKSVRKIDLQLEERLSAGMDTNTLITVSSADKDVRKLASDLNIQLKILRKEQLRYLLGDKEIKDAVTNVSHDLRTPLTAIYGYIELLSREDLSADSRHYLAVISERADAIKSLTDELFKYSVAVSEESELPASDVIINNVLEECISAYYAVIIQNHITPDIEICSAKLHRQLNPTALSRIFTNILSNAVKYSQGDLRICLTEDGTASFSNTAPQLDTVSAGRLFDRFYTVENADNSTGLGLSIAKALTERMGGAINAEFQTDSRELTVKVYWPE